MSDDIVAPRVVTVQALDGAVLHATVYEPQRAYGVAIVAPAIGVGQKFYAAFAAFLATRGWYAITFDYRGTGAARPERWRRFDATLHDWAVNDLGAILRLALELEIAGPRVFLGHSLAMHLFALAPDNARCDAAVAIASGSGYWGHTASRLRGFARAAGLRVLIGPLTRAFGYFPGRSIGVLNDLPRSATLDFARWCLHRDYLAGAEGAHAIEGFRRFTRPLLGLSFTDDELMSRAAVDALLACYECAELDRRHVAPGDAGLDAIGHFGFFALPPENRLWAEVAEWAASHSKHASMRNPQ